MSYKYGGRGASLATAHKVAKIIYAMLDKKQEFNFDLLIDSQSRYREQKIRQLERQIERLKKAA